jgi:hypothetical protein
MLVCTERGRWGKGSTEVMKDMVGGLIVVVVGWRNFAV